MVEDIKYYTCVLTDHDGITINGTTYKVNNGNPIDLCPARITMNLPVKAELRNPPNKTISADTTYSDLIGDYVIAGIDNKQVEVECVMWIEPVESPTGYTMLNMKLLHDLWMFNHTYYLKDYIGTRTDILSPINSLIDYTPLSSGNTSTPNSNKIYDSKGMPVTIIDISNISRGTDDERGAFITCRITFGEVKP